jgi:hypothetical protein
LAPGGKGIIATTLKNIPLNEQRAQTHTVFVSPDFFPTSGLNALYLSMW